MRGNPEWFRRIKDIQDCIESCDQQVFTRSSIEDLFQIKRTAAAGLMRRIGGLGRVAQTQTVSRRHLLLFVHKVQEQCDYHNEVARLERLDQKLEDERAVLAARRRPIQGADRRKQVAIDGLPEVKISPSRLTIEFHGTDDLLRKLYELSQAIVQDWNRFEHLAEQI